MFAPAGVVYGPQQQSMFAPVGASYGYGPPAYGPYTIAMEMPAAIGVPGIGYTQPMTGITSTMAAPTAGRMYGGYSQYMGGGILPGAAVNPAAAAIAAGTWQPGVSSLGQQVNVPNAAFASDVHGTQAVGTQYNPNYYVGAEGAGVLSGAVHGPAWGLREEGASPTGWDAATQAWYGSDAMLRKEMKARGESTDQYAGMKKSSAPPGINAAWWDEFTAQHGGQDPDTFYERQGEGLAEALADRDWGAQFAQAQGRPPTDDEWRVHWFQTRTGMSQEDRDAWRRKKETRRTLKQTTGGKLPWARSAQEAAAGGGEARPPLWVPPSVTWM